MATSRETLSLLWLKSEFMFSADGTLIERLTGAVHAGIVDA